MNYNPILKLNQLNIRVPIDSTIYTHTIFSMHAIKTAVDLKTRIILGVTAEFSWTNLSILLVQEFVISIQLR